MDYRIIKIKNDQTNWRENANTADVDIFPWPAVNGEDFRPVTTVKMAACDDSLFVFMETSETEIRAEARGLSRQVYTDSCMEFFLSADPANSNQYINWEFNPAGALCLAVGTHRYDRHEIQIDAYMDLFQVKTNIRNNGWSIEYRIPFAFLRSCFPSLKLSQGHIMRGNFYKCGDKTARPHYGCWSPIDLPYPDFHCPAFFGTLILE
jgi:hypothetical protein